MKKNYIAPSSELLDLASEGLMQTPTGIAFATNAASGGTPTFNQGEEIV